MLFMNDENYPEDRRLSPEANRNALFIMLYRDYPLLNMPYRLLEMLLNIDELLAPVALSAHEHGTANDWQTGRYRWRQSGAEYLKKCCRSALCF
ncbi:MAG: hypothetical protein IPN94_03350 [Sphingobacteriales bacterium]|nr:hypothetical protein [Sphingobacteriales bacterium]